MCRWDGVPGDRRRGGCERGRTLFEIPGAIPMRGTLARSAAPDDEPRLDRALALHLDDPSAFQFEGIGQPLAGHTNDIQSIAFSPDGKTLATSGADDTIILWDVAGRSVAARLHGVEYAVNVGGPVFRRRQKMKHRAIVPHVVGVFGEGGFEDVGLDDHDRNFNPRKHTLDDRPLPPVEPGSGYYTATAMAQHAIDMLRELEKEKMISEDELFEARDKVQHLTDDYIKQIDEILKAKEADIMKV